MVTIEVGQLWVKLGLDKSGFDNGVKDAQGQSTGLGGFIKNAFAFTVGQGMFDLLKTGLKSVWDTSIGFNSQMQQSTAAFTTLLGSADKAQKTLKDLSNMAASTPFELTDLTKASQTLLGFGVDSNQVMNDLKMLGDVSMGNKEHFDGLTLAFAQIQSAGKMTGQDLLQLINAGFNPLTIISKQTGESMAQLKDDMAKGAISADMVTNAFKAATSQGGLFYGAMDKQSTTFAGLMSTLADNVKTTLGNIMMPEFQTLSNVILPKAIDMVNKFGQGFKSGGIEGAFKAAFPPEISSIITGIGNAIQFVTDHSTLFKTILAGVTTAFIAYNVAVIASRIATEANGIALAISAVRSIGLSAASEALAVNTEGTTVAQWALNAALNANPLGIIIMLIAALVGGLIYLWNTNTGFKAAVINAWNEIKAFFENIPTFFSNLWQGIVNEVIREWNIIKDFFTTLWTTITTGIQTAWNSITTFFITIWNGIVNVFTSAITSITSFINDKFFWQIWFFQDIFTQIQSIFSNAWDIIKNVFLGAILIICDLLTGNFSKAKSDLSSIMNNISTDIENIWNHIKQYFFDVGMIIEMTLSDAWKAISNEAQADWNAIKSFFETLWTEIKNTASTTWSDFKTSVSNTWNSIVQGGEDIWNGLINWFKALPQNLHDIAVNMFTSMKNGVTSTITGVVSAVKTGFNEAINWIKALPGEAVQWGSDFVDGIVNGINGAVHKVTDSVSALAAKIRSYLHFSVPDEGPLKDYQSWMPDFVNGLASSLQSSKDLLTKSISGLALDMSVSAKQNVQGTSASNKTQLSGGLTLYIEQFINNTSKDIENLAIELENYRKMYSLATGGE